MVTHDIAEAVSMSNRVVVLTKRPSEVKNIYEIKLQKQQNPTKNRKDPLFIEYYEKIWKELEQHV